MKVHSGSYSGTYFYAYDGNGNVSTLIDTTGAVAASYEYGPFGEPIRATGPLALINPFRFSTKYTDNETTLVYYGHRFYSPSTGKWLSRDPIGEKGGENLFAFVKNNGVNHYDKLGLMHSFSGIGERVKYYCKCGWIDHGHLGTGGMYDLIDAAMKRYEANPSRDEFELTQQQTGRGGVSVTYQLRYNGKPAGKERLELACGIFMETQRQFENYQGGIGGGDMVTRSSFSVEDLPSDFLGFMMRAGTIKDVESECGKPLSVKDCKRMWKYGDGPRENDSHVPKLWSMPDEYTHDIQIGGINISRTVKCKDPCSAKDKTIPSIFTDYQCNLDESKAIVVDENRLLPIIGR